MLGTVVQFICPSEKKNVFLLQKMENYTDLEVHL